MLGGDGCCDEAISHLVGPVTAVSQLPGISLARLATRPKRSLRGDAPVTLTIPTRVWLTHDFRVIRAPVDGGSTNPPEPEASSLFGGLKTGSEAAARPDVGSNVAHLKQYQVMELVGEGGMGWVYRAWDPLLERDVALKVLKPEVPEAERARFRNEALYGARFLHPGFVRVYDTVGVPRNGMAWFAMEYLPGRDLEDVIGRTARKEAQIPFRLLADVFRQILGALQYAHDCGVVHRDVKPANMFVTRDPNTRFVTTKLLDFGVALDLRKEQQESRLVGDPRYMPPEQHSLRVPLDPRADVYAAGMSLYEAVTGRHPYEDYLESTRKELLAVHMTHRPPLMSNYMPDDTPPEFAEGLESVFELATAVDRNKRFATAGDMQRALGEVFKYFLG